jgi:hypothetical protein
MKQLGNLALICAKRKDVSLQIYDGAATVYTGCGPERASAAARCDDDERISEIIRELNFGKFAGKGIAMTNQNERQTEYSADESEISTCPLCGAEPEFDGSEFEENSVGYHWVCDDCGAKGTEWHIQIFDGHVITEFPESNDVTDADD